jgi:hypothetical protein
MATGCSAKCSKGTNFDPTNGPYETIHTITSEPPALSQSVVTVDLKDYRYLRYRGPVNSFANVAEVEFYRDGARVTGVGLGTPGFMEQHGQRF